VKILQLAAAVTATLLISGCSRVTTVSERPDYRTRGGKSIEVKESWALPEFVKTFRDGFERLFEDAVYQHGWQPFIGAWCVIFAVGWAIAKITD
jgi:hypothetical protein